jgi:hypothetical protein
MACLKGFWEETMDLLDRWKTLAKIENARMLEPYEGQKPNYGIVKHKIKNGGPRLSEINRSLAAQKLLELSQKGYTLEEVLAETNDPIEKVIGRARRYQITFKGQEELL